MRAKRIVVAAALVALLSGGAAMAADSRTAGKAGPTVKSGEAEIYQSNGMKHRVARFRGRWDQVRNIPPEYVVRPADTCSDSPLAVLVAGMFGFEELARSCELDD